MEKSFIEKIKLLRSKTNISFLECKNALEKTNGNIEESIIFLRENCNLKIKNKSYRKTSEGVISILINNDIKQSIIIEVNCETDFVAKSDEFLKYVEKISDFLLYKFKYKNENLLEEEIKLNDYLKEENSNIISKTGENITIKRIKYFNEKNKFHFGYIHGGTNNIGKIGTILILNEDYNDINIVKDLAIQIIATKPTYIEKKYIPEKILNDEKKIYLKIAKEKYPEKDEKIIEKIINKQTEDFIEEITLLEQDFVKNQSIKIKDIIKNKIELTNFIRFEIGE